MVFFAVFALAAFLLTAPSASARTTVCIPESLRLTGSRLDSICVAVPTPSITPPFTAFTEQNGSQNDWCLFSQPKYAGFSVRVPAFSHADVVLTVASARPC
jgi:hypothetical protein